MINEIEHIVNQYYTRVFRFALKYVKAEYMAKDIAQDTFYSLMKYNPDYNQIKNLEHYIFTISKNLIIKYLKEEKTRQKILENMSFQSVEIQNFENVDTTSTTKQLECLIRNLPEKQRQIVVLGKLQGLSYEQISQKLGISRNTVKNHMVQGLKNLRKLAISINLNNTTILYLIILNSQWTLFNI